MPKSIASSVDNGLKTLLTPNPEAQAKYVRTYRWLYPICNIWNDISYQRDRLVAEGKLVMRPGT